MQIWNKKNKINIFTVDDAEVSSSSDNDDDDDSEKKYFEKNSE